MYGQNNSSFYDHFSDFIDQSNPTSLAPMLVRSLTDDYESMNEAFMLANVDGNTSTGSGCTSNSYTGSPTSPLSCTSHLAYTPTTLMQQSLKSHSLLNNGFHLPVSSAAGFVGLDIGPGKRVSSTGDLDQGFKTLLHHHHHLGSPLGNESTSIIIEGMTKACRYSPEEKKERIEKYRSKRSQRNFNKKIQYACRKTLADSRPRVRGRFAKSDEVEQPVNCQDLQWNQGAGEEDDEHEEHWIDFLNSLSSNLVP
ncbi:unnamed protein product [Amaranthus hypochondriacus]